MSVQKILMLGMLVSTHPNYGSTGERCSTRVGSGMAHECQTWLERLHTGKCFILFDLFTGDVETKFSDIGTLRLREVSTGQAISGRSVSAG